MPARMECASTGGTRSRKKKRKRRRLSKIAFQVEATKTVPASSRPASSTTLANCPRQPGAASKAWAMKCARIKAQPTIHSRTVREGACLRRETKMPSKTQSTRIVGSLSSRELMKVVWGTLDNGMLWEERRGRQRTLVTYWEPWPRKEAYAKKKRGDSGLSPPFLELKLIQLLALGIRSVLGRYHRDRGLQLEVQHGLRRQQDLLALGGCGNAGAGASAYGGANSRALAASQQTTQDGADGGTAAYFGGRRLAARAALTAVLVGLQAIAPAIHGKPGQRHDDVRLAGEAAGALDLVQTPGYVEAGRDYDIAVFIGQRGIESGAKTLAGLVLLAVNWLNQTNSDVGSGRNHDRLGGRWRSRNGSLRRRWCS